MKRIIPAFFLLSTFSNTILADVEIRMQAADGTMTHFWVGEESAKMAAQNANGYAIINFKEQKQYMIDHFEKMVIDITDGIDGENPESSPNKPGSQNFPPSVTIEKVSDGPKIAGFNSNKYEVKAGDTLCSIEYLSTEPFRHSEMKQLFDTMAAINSTDINNTELYSPCEQASLTLEQQHQTLGIPLKSVTPAGEVTSEVVHFQVHKAPEGTYNFPANYKKATISELLQEQMGNISPHQ